MSTPKYTPGALRAAELIQDCTDQMIQDCTDQTSAVQARNWAEVISHTTADADLLQALEAIYDALRGEQEDEDEIRKGLRELYTPYLIVQLAIAKAKGV